MDESLWSVFSRSRRKHDLERDLSERCQLDVVIVLNENRTTMLNVLKQDAKGLTLSMHRIFLNASPEIREVLAAFLLRKSKRQQSQTLRQYIYHQLNKEDYSDRVNQTRLVSAGKVYHLESLFTEVNEVYFSGSLDIPVTWYGRATKKYTRTLGLYDSLLQVIKIHHCLDRSTVPKFFISFVMYHEMLHHVVPSQIDSRGHCRHHNKTFRDKEREFLYYREAKEWEKKHIV